MTSYPHYSVLLCTNSDEAVLLRRVFQLRLQPDSSVFHKDLVVETTTLGKVKPDISHIYSGKVVGDPSSYVFGALHGGVFEGTIQTNRGRFYVEPAHSFFPRPTPFHSVLYSIRDVRMPRAHGPQGWCGLRGETERWMKQLVAMSTPVKPQNNLRTPSAAHEADKWIGRKPLGTVEERTGDYSELDDNTDAEPGDKKNASARNAEYKVPHRVCGLFIFIDHTLYNKFFQPDRNAMRARERISALIATHVARASKIYGRTSFWGIRDISFTVSKVEINDTSSCKGSKSGLCRDWMDSALYLLTLAKWKSFDEYCLAYAWTYRDFDDGLLGLAYMALDEPPTQGAGVCDTRRTGPVDPNHPERGLAKMNLNTGIVSFLSSSHFVPHAISELTFSHEIGHSFGSPHDIPDSSPCVPDNVDGGHFLMYPSSSSGNKPNNDNFSPCSIKNISRIILPMLKGESTARANCFQVDSGPICGNQLVEADEECDCGYHEGECSEPCCYPRDNSVGAKGCTLKPGKLCSPSQGPCCTAECEFAPTSMLCSPATECRGHSYCTGNTSACPAGEAKPNMTLCGRRTQVCLSGECLGSVCLKYGYTECSLSGAGYSIEEKCMVACERSDECRIGCDLAGELCMLKLQPGSTCDDERGFCDEFSKCRQMDEKGPLTRLHEALFGGKTYRSIKDYIEEHPFLTVLYIVVAGVVLALFLRILAVHTPSSHPRKPALQFAETLRSPGNIFRQMHETTNVIYMKGPPPPKIPPGDIPEPPQMAPGDMPELPQMASGIMQQPAPMPPPPPPNPMPNT
ncbi:disintegrin and metalloproteinase domain-containing protein 10-like [Haemaphysalis longicornis]